MTHLVRRTTLVLSLSIILAIVVSNTGYGRVYQNQQGAEPYVIQGRVLVQLEDKVEPSAKAGVGLIAARFNEVGLDQIMDIHHGIQVLAINCEQFIIHEHTGFKGG